MNEKDFIQMFQQAKDAPELGGGFSYSHMREGWNRVADALGFQPAEFPLVPSSFSFWDSLRDIAKISLSASMRPLAVGVSLFALVFGGWVATVNASFASVPGDFLYPVKLATERVQLTLALANDGQRARLHTEFASRRLEEVMEIASSTREGKEDRVQEAVDNFKQEMASVNQELTSAGSAHPDTVAELAMVVDRKADEYSAVLDQTQEKASLGEHQNQVQEARDAVEETKQQATEVIVTTHEAQPEAETATYLQSAFQKDLTDIRAHMNESYGRLAVIEGVLDSVEQRHEEDLIDVDASLLQVQTFHETLRGFDEDMNQAMDFFAAGGYRRVLEGVTHMKSTLAQLEQNIQTMEIEISTRLMKAETEQTSALFEQNTGEQPIEHANPEEAVPSDSADQQPVQP